MLWRRPRTKQLWPDRRSTVPSSKDKPRACPRTKQLWPDMRSTVGRRMLWRPGSRPPAPRLFAIGSGHCLPVGGDRRATGRTPPVRDRLWPWDPPCLWPWRMAARRSLTCLPTGRGIRPAFGPGASALARTRTILERPAAEPPSAPAGAKIPRYRRQAPSRWPPWTTPSLCLYTISRPAQVRK